MLWFILQQPSSRLPFVTQGPRLMAPPLAPPSELVARSPYAPFVASPLQVSQVH
jgi:hypothetical protein